MNSIIQKINTEFKAKGLNLGIVVLLISSLILHLYYRFDFTLSNDSVSNIEQISALDIFSRSSHFTFHLFGAIFYYTMSQFMDVSCIHTTEFMLSLLSIAGTYSLYKIANQLFKNNNLAFISAIIYSISSGVLRFSIQCEYLILVPSLGLISLALYSHKKFLLSGLVLSFALLTSPFIILFSPAYLLFQNIKTILNKNTFFFILGFISVYLLVSYFTIHETLTGDWSYGFVLKTYTKTLLKINYFKVLLIYAYGYLRSFILILPFFIFGLYLCYKSHRKLFYIALLIIIFHLPAAIPEQRYGGYQLTVYPFVAIISSLGLFKLLKSRLILIYIVVFLVISINVYIVNEEFNFNKGLTETYVQLQNSREIPDSSILFVYQASKPIRKLYAPRFKVVEMHTNSQESLAKNLPFYIAPALNKIIDENTSMYLIESGVSMPDDKIKILFGSLTKKQGSKLKGFGKEKILSANKDVAFLHQRNYPIDTYKVVKQN